MSLFKNFAHKSLGLFVLCFVVASCASKKQAVQPQLSGNRKMSFAIRNVKDVDVNWRAKIAEIGRQGIKAAYQSQIVDLDFQKDSLLESPENLYKIGISEVDDLFVADLEMSGDNITIATTILNGANLKMVNVFRISANTKDPTGSDEVLIKQIKSAALETYPNPNIYPKSDPQHYADLLYILSKKGEESSEKTLTCENAPEVLKYYPSTAALYKLATDRGISKIVGQQSENHQLSSRLAECEERAKILVDCAEDAKKHFEIQYDFGKVSAENQERIKKAVEDSGLGDILKKYTPKPVLIRFTLDGTSDLSLRINLRYDQARYTAWTKDRIPMKFRTYQILSLDPYYALMQKMIVLRTSLPKDSPAPLVRSFDEMKMTLALTTLLGGEVSFGVDGKYSADRKSMKMAYPASLQLVAPGFDSKAVDNKSKELFIEKGWIALGSCKTIDGTITEDGLVYKFFGFPCQ